MQFLHLTLCVMVFNVGFIPVAKFICSTTLPYTIPFYFQSFLSLPSLLFCRCHTFLQPIDKTKRACVYMLVYVCIGGGGEHKVAISSIESL